MRELLKDVEPKKKRASVKRKKTPPKTPKKKRKTSHVKKVLKNMKTKSPKQYKVLKSMIDMEDNNDFVVPDWMEEMSKVKKKKISYYKRKKNSDKSRLARIDIRVVWNEWRKLRPSERNWDILETHTELRWKSKNQLKKAV